MFIPRSWSALTLALIVALPLAAAPRLTGEVGGIARVIDGDTLDVGGTRVRLAVVDAPERGQTCDQRGKPLRCGQAATAALIALAEGRRVACEVGPRRSHRRVVGWCRTAERVLNLALIEAGQAVILPRYLAEWPDQAPALRAAETAARKARRGLWGMQAMSPEVWRGGSGR
jgi:endonuclease YncB( thermonuclease family)